MTASLQKTVIRRLNKVFLAAETSENSVLPEVFGAGAGNISRLGYWFTKSAAESLASQPQFVLEEILKALQELKGDAEYVPMYPNFPEQVASMSSFELYMNAVVHYIGDIVGVRIVPNYGAKEREKLTDDTVKIQSLGVATPRELSELFKEIASSGQAFSSVDLEDLTTLVDFCTELPESLKNKENLVVLSELLGLEKTSRFFTTPTDVLRLAASWSGGDLTLTEPTKFSLSRPQRRAIFELLAKVLADNPSSEEDLARYAEEWKRLARTLHYRELSSRSDSVSFKNASESLQKLQKGEIVTYNSRLELALLNGDLTETLHLLTSRPGVFGRRLAEVLRKFPESHFEILEAFRKVARRISIPVLVSMWNFFSGPQSDVLPIRRILLKGKKLRTVSIPNRLSGDFSEVLEAIEFGLLNRRADKKIYFDEELAEQRAVPLGLRNSSEALKILGRGSRIRISDDKDIVRLFMHWRDMNDNSYRSRVDLDLSVSLMDEKFENRKTISYFSQKLPELDGYLSGDLTSAPNGAAEFIDFNISKAYASGSRYAIASVYNFTGQKLSEVPEAWAGYMLRSDSNSGEIFEPKTVENRFSLSSESTSSIVFALDLKTRELIWLDTSSGVNTYGMNAINSGTVLHDVLCENVLSKKMTVGYLLKLIATVSDDEDSEFFEVDTPQSVLALIAD